MNGSSHPANHAPASAPAAGKEAVVAIKLGPVTSQVRVGDIRTVAACENYTQVTLADGRHALVRRTLQQWATLLPAEQFARVHRGLLINVERVGRIDRGRAHSAKLHFVEKALAPVEVKRRHWPALRARIEAARQAAVQDRALRPTEPSVAVLPFIDLSGQRGHELFCDGISEELLNVLAQVPGLRVAARTSSFFFKGKTVPVAQVARELGVDFVLEGSVRAAGRRVRITAQLINGADGFHVWSDNFDRERRDILSLQDEIAAVIAERLQLRLAGPRIRRTVDREVHRLTLEGRHYWNLRTHDGFDRAEKAFTAAASADPSYAPAHAGLADLRVVRAMYRLADGAEEANDDLDGAERAAQRALELEPTLAEPHAALGFVWFHRGRLGQAVRHFPRAFAANPNYATGYQFHAWTLAATGRLDRALKAYERAIELDPLSFINIDRWSAMLFLAGRHNDALAANGRAAALRPDVFVGNLSQYAPILWALGRKADAVAAARAVRHTALTAPYRRHSDADALYVLHQAGLTAEAADYADEMLGRLPANNHLRGFVLAAVGRHTEAMESLVRTPTILQPFLYWSPLWDPVREEPAFGRLMAHLGRTREYRIARATLSGGDHAG